MSHIKEKIDQARQAIDTPVSPNPREDGQRYVRLKKLGDYVAPGVPAWFRRDVLAKRHAKLKEIEERNPGIAQAYRDWEAEEGD